MKKRVFGFLAAVCALCCCVLSACKPSLEKTKYSAHSFEYFDTATTITGYETDKETFDAVVGEIFDQLAEYHKLYTIYHRFEGLENLCTVNELVNGAHRTVKVDRRVVELLLYAKEMYKKTDGMLNVAMGSVLSLWHDYRAVGSDNPADAALPPMEKLKAASLHTDIEKLLIDEQNNTVTLTDPQMKLDVGAIAKGYATEQIALYLENKGITGYVLNVGGNVRTIGSKPDGQPWVVGLENGNGGDYLAYLQLRGQSVVTSGSYQRYYVVDGKRYHHIIHPATQMPAEGFLSVSVICRDSGLGDALSTALFCMPLEEGKSLIEALPDVEALWVSDSGEQTRSSGFEAFVKS